MEEQHINSWSVDVNESNEVTQSTAWSSMQPYYKGLRLVKLLGLPFKINNKDGRDVTFAENFRFMKCVIPYWGKQMS